MKIVNKITFSVFFIAFVCSALGLSYIYIVVRNNSRQLIEKNLEEIVHSRKDHIETYLKMLEISVGQLSKDITDEDFLKISDKESPQRNEAFGAAMKRLKRTKEANPSIAEFLLMDKSGKVVASSDESSIGSDKSTDSFFLGGQEKTYIKDVYYSETYKQPLIAASAPVLNSYTGELLGVLAARVKLNDLNAIVADRTGMGDTGDIYIVNKYGYMVTPSRFRKDVVLKQRADIFPDYRGIKVLGVYEYIPQMQWSVLAEVEAKEAFAPLVAIRNIFVIIFSGILLFAWLLGLFASRTIESLNQEIALRKKREKTLRELSVAVEQSPACVVITDVKGKIQYVNPKFVQLTGYGPQEVIGQNPRFLKTGEQPAEFYKNLWDTITAGKEWRGEFHNKKRNGELYWESASISPIRDEKGVVTNFIAVKEDITERKRLEHMKDDFMSTVSHELRTPLTAIKEGINIVFDGSAGAINGEQQEFLGIAKRNVDRLARLINEVLDFQKLESGSMAFNMQENDISQVGREVKEGMAPLASSKGLELLLEIEEGLPKVKFDRDKITQVLTNLVNNAIKFTDKGSIAISIKPGDNIIKVSVRDTGPGMKDEDIGKLFQKFVQLERSSDRKTGGAGLGLAISKDIIDKHNGKIWAESEPGKGSVFIFCLPISL